MVRSMMISLTLPTSFWGYALYIVRYLLNLVPYKLVPLTLIEMWMDRKPSLHHICTRGYPVHMLKLKLDKLEPRSEVCQFVGYPKGSKGYQFYSQVDQKVFVSTNSRFLEDDYMMCNMVKSEVNLRVLNKTLTIAQNLWIQYQPFSLLVYWCLIAMRGLLYKQVDSCI